MRPPSIGILEAGAVTAPFAAEHGGFGDWFERFLGEAFEGRARFRVYRAFESDLPQQAEDCDAYLITGSAASVLDAAPWMVATGELVRAAAAARPVVGICFGHQLIAAAFGGRVERADEGWGVGVHSYEVRVGKSWMAPATERFSILASHMDQVVEPPPEAEVLAGSDFCPTGMMQIGENVLTLQNHPEVTKPFASALYRSRTEVLGAATAQAALESLAADTDEALIGQWIAQFVRERVPAD